MGFRDYSPGLNRFLTRDSYNGALADMQLGLNPFTGNRYAFGGGNPISAVELDGHCWSWAQGICDAAETAGDWLAHNADTLGDLALDTLEIAAGAAGTAAGVGMIASGVAACAVSVPLVVTGIGAAVTAGTCAGGAGLAGVGVFVAGLGMFAMADGISRAGNDAGRLENPPSSGSGTQQLSGSPHVSSERSGHIRDRHGPGARDRDPDAGEFDEDFFYNAKDEDVLDQKLIDAVNNKNATWRVNDKGPGYIYRYDYGKGNEIGWKKGQRTSVVEVVVREDGTIWTAYPTL
jgi:hypothetical protein